MFGPLAASQAIGVGRDGVAFFPGLDFFECAVAAVAHTLGVWAGAVGFAFDKGGSAAAAGALQGLAGCLVDEVDVIAVNGDTGQAVGGGAIGDLGIAGGVGEGYLGGELIVFSGVSGFLTRFLGY